MRSPQFHRNEENRPSPRIPSPHFNSTVSVQKLRSFNTLILIFRFASFCFSLASTVFMVTNSRGGSDSPNWQDFDAFIFVFAANAIVAVYSFFEMLASVWEILKGTTVLPEIMQVWFDFGHDQVFAYLLLSADAAGTALVMTLRGTDTCTHVTAFCVQSGISIALGFAGFMFLGLSSLLSGFRLACFVFNGSRFLL
ncbi:hypothetical protein HHK36_010966 [Tetracentron sinense]|uniref:CASP-like protein n=1 Tax=Tetracentron sinense TaxID=13715 RepID=A0A835DK18_TETSI|nr:hypothetical protein HHK36_010966 [Tetracentron sinense]